MNLNTLEMAQRLEEQKFISRQAECIVKVVMQAIQNSGLVSEVFLTVKMLELETKLETKMAQLETRMTGKMEGVKTDMIKWMVGLQFALFSLIVAMMSGMLYFITAHPFSVGQFSG